MIRRWRPTLNFVLGGALFGTLGLSFVGLILLRYIGPEIGFRNAAMFLGLCITALTAVLGWLLVRLLLRPIRGLEAYASAHLKGDTTTDLKHYGTQEIQRTAKGVIAMAEALRDREASIRSYTDHVTHELKTPVSVIVAATELLGDGPVDDQQSHHLVAQIDHAAQNIQKQLEALRTAARARETRYVGTCRLADLEEPLTEAFPNLAIELTNTSKVFPISKDGLLIVLQQLLRNAVEHEAKSVSLRPSLEVDQTLTVSNDGQCIPAADLAHLFDPFFTTRRDNGGTGMGLAITKNILDANGGRITAVSTQDGATFTIQFS
ncbi:sensor histidine kinase KdpD [uncultured Roseobacter sp.]|uniref:sensor histidine kinase n=1 Tax=uncultured Roseobacter sp. TaxID=114847 RepID=UPI002614B475|nr:HAMP domain-containing sensor histidine kinase [uncultured Roseobacter sp.]